MNERQIQELLESYDRMRELMVRVNANMTRVNAVFDHIQVKESELEDKLVLLEKKADQGLETKLATLERRVNETGKKLDTICAGTNSAVSVSTQRASVAVSPAPRAPVVASSAPRARTLPAQATLKEFFGSRGLEVIDKRPSGGNLWVTGDMSKLRKAVDDAKELYKITGSYGSGRATKHRDGWFTKSSK